MTKLFTKSLLCSAALFGAIQTQAAVIQVEARGVITDSFDQTGIVTGVAGDDTLIGREVTATWTFDTNDIPTATQPLSYLTVYSSGANWITGTLDIGGVSSGWSEDSLTNFPDANDRDLIEIADGSTGSGTFDRYTIMSNNQDNDNPYGYQSFWSQARFVEHIEDIITTDPSQAFNWIDNDDEDHGTGFFRLTNSDPEESIWANYTVTSMTATVLEEATVSEPAVMYLFGLGLIGLGLVRRKHA